MARIVDLSEQPKAIEEKKKSPAFQGQTEEEN